MELGVSPRRLSGWEPLEVTEYEYDEDGRLVGSVTTREPEWSADDVNALLAFLDSKRVGSHGHPLSESMSPDADPASRDAKYRYVVPNPSVDFAARALSNAQDAYRKKYPEADMSSLRWRVERVDL